MTKTALYFSPQPTRSARARWAFIEAGVAFEGHAVDIFKGEHKGDDYLAVNPLGFVPAATYDGVPIIESSALALIAATDNPARELIAEVGTADWRRALQWVVFAPAELDHALATLNQHRLFRPPAQRNADIVTEATEHLDGRTAVVAEALSAGPYLLGDTFTVADVAVGHSIVWMQMHDLVQERPALASYLERLQSRPAFQEVYGAKVDVFPDPHAGG